MPDKGPVRCYTTAHRFAGRLEHHEKAVPLGPQFPTAILAERGPKQAALSRQRLPILLAQAVQERSRALDVAEQQGQGPRGESCISQLSLRPGKPRQVAHLDVSAGHRVGTETQNPAASSA